MQAPTSARLCEILNSAESDGETGGIGVEVKRTETYITELVLKTKDARIVISPGVEELILDSGELVPGFIDLKIIEGGNEDGRGKETE